ncbi:MAG: hypothetical protein K0Q49_2230, partial [Haloplasmataceae bacterium]|nr:hypothetical protein [Haloplasmataceae bacterium]
MKKESLFFSIIIIFVLSFVVLILYNEIFKDLLLFNKDEQVITTSSID